MTTISSTSETVSTSRSRTRPTTSPTVPASLRAGTTRLTRESPFASRSSLERPVVPVRGADAAHEHPGDSTGMAATLPTRPSARPECTFVSEVMTAAEIGGRLCPLGTRDRQFSLGRKSQDPDASSPQMDEKGPVSGQVRSGLPARRPLRRKAPQLGHAPPRPMRASRPRMPRSPRTQARPRSGSPRREALDRQREGGRVVPSSRRRWSSSSASPGSRMLPSSTITVGMSARLRVPRSPRTSIPSLPAYVDGREPLLDQDVPDHLGQPQRRLGDVGGPRCDRLGRDDVESVGTRDERPVRMDAELQVGGRSWSAGVAGPAALVDARAPRRRRVRGPGQQDPGTEPAQQPLGGTRHLPGERRLGIAAVRRRTRGVARLGEARRRRQEPHLGRERGVAELVPGIEHDDQPGEWRAPDRPSGRPPSVVVRAGGRPSPAARG